MFLLMFTASRMFEVPEKFACLFETSVHYVMRGIIAFYTITLRNFVVQTRSVW